MASRYDLDSLSRTFYLGWMPETLLIDGWKLRALGPAPSRPTEKRPVIAQTYMSSHPCTQPPHRTAPNAEYPPGSGFGLRQGGSRAVTGPHSWAHALIWVNRERLRMRHPAVLNRPQQRRASWPRLTFCRRP